MPISYELDAARDLVVMRASGLLTAHDVQDVVDKAITDTGGAIVEKDVLVLIDPATSLNQLDQDALLQIKAHVETWLKKYPRKPIKCAIVSEPVQKLVGELWSARTNFDSAVSANTRTFMSESEALSWLRP